MPDPTPASETAAELEMTLIRSLPLDMMHQAEIIENLGNFKRAFRKAALQEAARAVCSLCHGDIELHWSGNGNAYHSATNVVFCKAQPVHELIAEGDSDDAR